MSSMMQMLLGTGGGSAYGNTFTFDGTSYDLSSADCTVTSSGYYQLVAPEGGVKFKLFLWGGAGGNGSDTNWTTGSAGGYAYGEFELDAGTYVLLVGEEGKAHSFSPTNEFPDGGKGSDNSGGGGGSTRFGPNVADSSAAYNSTSFTYYLIAGGGGGGSSWAGNDSIGTEKGEGGGTDGGDGGWYYASDTEDSPGGGGSQSAGGSGGTGGRLADGNAGAKYSGGDAGDSNGGGGGGGGYYGGGGGASYYSQGGGGSGYIDTSVVSNGVLARGGTGSSLDYNEAYDGPNSEQPSDVGDSDSASDTSMNGGAVFKLL